jgi:hypothetical protein
LPRRGALGSSATDHLHGRSPQSFAMLLGVFANTKTRLGLHRSSKGCDQRLSAFR